MQPLLNSPKPAITGPIFIPHVSKTATVPKKIIRYFKSLMSHKTNALDNNCSNFLKPEIKASKIDEVTKI